MDITTKCGYENDWKYQERAVRGDYYTLDYMEALFHRNSPRVVFLAARRSDGERGRRTQDEG